MTEGIMSETMDQLAMMIEAYKKLSSKKPGHELLKIADLHPNERGMDLKPEYFEKFASGIEHNIQGYMRYTQALEDALYE